MHACCSERPLRADRKPGAVPSPRLHSGLGIKGQLNLTCTHGMAPLSVCMHAASWMSSRSFWLEMGFSDAHSDAFTHTILLWLLPPEGRLWAALMPSTAKPVAHCKGYSLSGRILHSACGSNITCVRFDSMAWQWRIPIAARAQAALPQGLS